MKKIPPKSPRPSDPIQLAKLIGDLAVGEKNPAAVALGKMGGKARAEKLSKKQRSEIAQKAAKMRWKKE